MQYIIDDDSGILSLLDCSAYASFVGEDWEYQQLLLHFKDQAKRQTILVWGAGDGGDLYRIEVKSSISNVQGHRATVGCITVTQGALNIASYTALTMAAQYEDELLPAKTEREYALPLENGTYTVRIVQMYDPAHAESRIDGEPHFLLEIELGESGTSHNVAWFVD